MHDESHETEIKIFPETGVIDEDKLKKAQEEGDEDLAEYYVKDIARLENEQKKKASKNKYKNKSKKTTKKNTT
jgi:hypothetical protein